MDEVWARVGVVAGALAVAGVAVLVSRHRARRPMRTVPTTGLAAGVYLFSSATCSSCLQAREKLETALGESGFAELTWEEDPRSFEDLGVDAVPAVMVVDGRGRGKLYPGQPEHALRAIRSGLDP